MTPEHLRDYARRVVQRVLVSHRAADGGEDMAGIVWAALRSAWREGVLTGYGCRGDAELGAALDDDLRASRRDGGKEGR